MPPLLLELELSHCPVVLVGLGVVGKRRLGLLVEAGALVRVVEPGPVDRAYAATLASSVEVVEAAYEASQLGGARLVFAAAPPEINRRVVEDARRLGLWVNSASDPCQGTLRVPALWQDGPVQLAVSTSGASPSLAALARTRAALALGPGFGVLATVLAELRPLVLARVADPALRAGLFKRWAGAGWLTRIESEGADGVRRAMVAEIEQVTGAG